MFQQFLVQNKNDIVFDDYTTSFSNETSILYYNCTITESTFYTPRTTTYETLFLVFSSSFFFYRRHIIFHIKTFFCFCFPHASLSPATSSVFAPNLHLDHFTVKPKSTYPSSQIFELPNANLKPTRQFVPKGFFEVTKLSDASSKQQPPRTLHLLSFISIQALSHNSSTLPVISYNPSSFGRFCPTSSRFVFSHYRNLLLQEYHYLLSIYIHAHKCHLLQLLPILSL